MWWAARMCVPPPRCVQRAAHVLVQHTVVVLQISVAHMMTVLCLVQMTRRVDFLCRAWCSSATASAHHYFKYCFCTQ